MLAESDGDARSSGMPDTLQALIAARIDRLPPAEKRLIQRAALIGRIFWEGALDAPLARARRDRAAARGPVLRELVLPEARSSISGERAFSSSTC